MAEDWSDVVDFSTGSSNEDWSDVVDFSSTAIAEPPSTPIGIPDTPMTEDNPLDMGFPMEDRGFIANVKDTMSIPTGAILHSLAQRAGLAEGDPKETQAHADLMMAEISAGHGDFYNAAVQAGAVIGEMVVLAGLGRPMNTVNGLSKARTASAIGGNVAKRTAAMLKNSGMQAILADFGSKVYVETLNRTGDHAHAAKQAAW